MAESMLERTYRLLECSDLTYLEIADGADVGYEWLKSFAIRRIASPGVTPVEKLHDFLASQDKPARNPNRSQNLARAGNG